MLEQIDAITTGGMAALEILEKKKKRQKIRKLLQLQPWENADPGGEFL